MAARWHDGTVTMYLKSGHVLTFDGGVRMHHDSTGAVEDYEARGGVEFLLLPSISAVDAIAVTPNAVPDE